MESLGTAARGAGAGAKRPGLGGLLRFEALLQLLRPGRQVATAPLKRRWLGALRALLALCGPRKQPDTLLRHVGRAGKGARRVRSIPVKKTMFYYINSCNSLIQKVATRMRWCRVRGLHDLKMPGANAILAVTWWHWHSRDSDSSGVGDPLR